MDQNKNCMNCAYGGCHNIRNKWYSCDNTNNVFIFERFYKKSSMVIVLNFSANQYDHYRFKVSENSGYYVEALNSDTDIYNGYGCVNNYNIGIDNNEIGIRVPSFGAVVLKHKSK